MMVTLAFNGLRPPNLRSVFLSNRNKSTDLHSKLIDWLYMSERFIFGEIPSLTVEIDS